MNKHLKYLLSLLLLSTSVYADNSNVPAYQGSTQGTNQNNVATNRTRLKEFGATGLYDGSLEVTGKVQADRYYEFRSTGTPSTPVTNHARQYLDEANKRICAVFDNGTLGCYASGQSTGPITGVTAGLGLSGGGTTGNVTVNLSTPVATGNLPTTVAYTNLDNNFTHSQTIASSITATTAHLTNLNPSTNVCTDTNSGLTTTSCNNGTVTSVSAGFGLNETGSANAPTLNLVTVTTATSIAFVNKIINGDMFYDTTNGGSTVTVNTGNFFALVDKWFGAGANSAGVYTVDKTSGTPPSNFIYYLHNQFSTKDITLGFGADYYIEQVMRADQFRDLVTANGWSASTLSFWVRSSSATTFSGGIGAAFGTGGRNFIFAFTINAVNTWQLITINIPADTGATNGYNPVNGWSGYGGSLVIDLGSRSNDLSTSSGSWAGGYLPPFGTTFATKLSSTTVNWLELTGVQLQTGPTATQYDFRNQYTTGLAAYTDPFATNAACTGCIGEHITSYAGATTVTSATNTDLTSITLPPGNWEILGEEFFDLPTGVATAVIGCISASAGNTFTGCTQGDTRMDTAVPTAPPSQVDTGVNISLKTSISSNTTYNLKCYMAHTLATANCGGRIDALRTN